MPAAYTAQQKSAISEFTSVTQSDKTTAAKILRQHNWNVGGAINGYFNNPNGAANPTRPALSKIFDKYRDNPSEEPDEMNIDGLTELLGEMDIEPGDMGALIFSEIVSSPSLGKVTREG
ncbi:hypothetical protein KC352_g38947, partial [Hortaea werneckii]